MSGENGIAGATDHIKLDVFIKLFIGQPGIIIAHLTWYQREKMASIRVPDGVVLAIFHLKQLKPQTIMKKYDTIVENDSPQFTTDEEVIRQRIAEYVAAIRAKDLEKVMSIFAPDLVSFDLEAPLQHMKAESKRQNWIKAFTAYQGPLEYEIRDLTITLGKDLAVGRSVNRISGTLSNGRKMNYWVRWTTCFEKISGDWYITHDHVSVPLDVATGKGVLDIEP